MTDHPRIRGEHEFPLLSGQNSLGSSPHTRGAPEPPDSATSSHRIIPAYAGSTSTGSSSSARRADHPRIRGEHVLDQLADAAAHGSSPHTRGALMSAASPSPPPGIIPAYAGSTVLHCTRVNRLRDHPRIRGEHAPAVDVDVTFQGSSPHTRGARDNPEQT